MSMLCERFRSSALTTATGNVVIGPIDISIYEYFAISVSNLGSSALLDIQPELALAPVGTASSLNFVAANTSIIGLASALGASATDLTSAVRNTYKYLRFKAHTSATNAGNSGTLVGAICGPKRRS